jgi:hypothetical protein
LLAISVGEFEIQWTWSHANPAQWVIMFHAVEGGTLFQSEPTAGADRNFVMDGDYFDAYVVGLDDDNNPVTEPSNVVHPS